MSGRPHSNNGNMLTRVFILSFCTVAHEKGGMCWYAHFTEEKPEIQG